MRAKKRFPIQFPRLLILLGSLAGSLSLSAQTNSEASPASDFHLNTPAAPLSAPSAGVSSPAATVPATTSLPPDNADPLQASVVKVFSTAVYPNPYKPWSKGSPTDVTGSGVIIDGHHILTNAHVVRYGNQVYIQDNQGGDKIPATVQTVAPGIDLALLSLNNDAFFSTHPPIPRASVVPQIRDSVTVYGYPEGGDTLSLTKGIVSRVEFTPYYYDVSGLRIQIDAAINSGNSGGAAIVDGKLVGIAFSRLDASTNIGYIIPSEEIDLFLKEIVNNTYQGKPALFDDFQTLENQALRPFLKLDATTQGSVVNKPFSSDPAYPLKHWDVVTKIGDSPVDDQGMVAVGNLHLRFKYLVQKFARDGKVPLTIMRAGTSLQIEVPVVTERPWVVPSLKDSFPSYFICGSLVFSNATREYLEDFVKTTKAAEILNGFIYSNNPLATRMMDQPAFPGERLVIVASPFFPDKLSEGYGNPMTSVIKSVNDIPIQNLAHLVQVLRDSKDEFINIEFFGYHREALVFRRVDMLSTTDEILTNNGIRDQGSPDVMAIWNAKPTQ